MKRENHHICDGRHASESADCTPMNALQHPPRRSALYVPASNPRALAKVGGLDADAVVFDLEDAVAPEMKEAARGHLLQVFEAGRSGPQYRVVPVSYTHLTLPTKA